jgi:hypothetical protein
MSKKRHGQRQFEGATIWQNRPVQTKVAFSAVCGNVGAKLAIWENVERQKLGLNLKLESATMDKEEIAKSQHKSEEEGHRADIEDKTKNESWRRLRRPALWT